MASDVGTLKAFAVLKGINQLMMKQASEEIRYGLVQLEVLLLPFCQMDELWPMVKPQNKNLELS